MNDFTCGERIRGLQARQDLDLDENGACKVVSEEYPGKSLLLFQANMFMFLLTQTVDYFPSTMWAELQPR